MKQAVSKGSCDFSIVVPVYRCDQCLAELCARLDVTLSSMDKTYEIVFVNDGSPDESWKSVSSLSQQDKRIKGVNLSRNFGQHYAITAGLEYSSGDWVVVMDCDLQDRPEEVPKLFAKAQEGYEIVYGQRKQRKDTWLKRMSSKLFYVLFSYLTDTRQDASIGNFGIYHRKVITAILTMKDHIRYFPTMSQWVGFRETAIEVEHSSRAEGGSSYSLRKLLILAFNNIIAFSDKPLRLAVKLGFTISLAATVLGVIYLIRYFMGEIIVMGFASLIISIWFLSGMIIFILGIVGIYIGKTFERVKSRPIYIVDETLNLDD